MPQRNVYHVVPLGDEWAVRLEGSSSPSATVATRGEALDAASGFLQRLGEGRVVVHDEEGRIESGYSLASLPTRAAQRRWRIAAGVLGVAFLAGLTVAVARRD